MRSVTAFARGLFGLLGSKSDGRGIMACEEALRLVVDSTKFLGANKRISGYFPLAAAVAGNNIATQVPPGKIWIVRGGGVSVDAPAASTARIQPRVMTPASNVSTVMGPATDITAGTSGSSYLAFQDFVLEAGSGLSIYLTNVTGGPFPASFTVLVEEFEAY